MYVYECNLYVCCAKIRHSNKTKKSLKRKGVKKMKKFTKLFLSCALVSVVATATAAMASAVDIEPAKTGIGLKGTYTNGVVTIDTTSLTKLDATKQATFLVVEGDGYTSDAKVEGIDQEEGAGFKNTGLKTAPADTSETKLTLYVGFYDEDGAFQLASGTLFAPKATGVAKKIGDMNWDGVIDGGDGTALLRTIASLEKGKQHGGEVYKATVTFDNEKVAAGADVKIGDMNLDTVIDGGDGTALLRTIANLEKGKQYGGQEITLDIPAAE